MASLILVPRVHNVADDEETEHEGCEVRNEPLGMPHYEEFCQDDDQHSHGEGNLIHQFHLETLKKTQSQEQV